MGEEDDCRRRFFIILSVLFKVAAPLFRQPIEKHFNLKGFKTFKDFLNDQCVKHSLFHMRYSKKCCQDTKKCSIIPQRHLDKFQFDQLYTISSGSGCVSMCHCCISANNISLEDLDISLASPLLTEFCSVYVAANQYAYDTLRKCRNNLSHSANGKLDEIRYNEALIVLESNIMQIDCSKKDEFYRIQKRPLDEALYQKYHVYIIEQQQKVEVSNIA